MAHLKAALVTAMLAAVLGIHVDLARAEEIRTLRSAATITNIKDCAPTVSDYPKESLAKREQGLTKIRFSIDAAGNIEASSISGSSGFPHLDAIALKRLSQCSFRPALSHQGLPERSSLEVSYAWRVR